MDYPEIYAVDFDKTLNLADTYPELGEPNMELIEFLKERRAAGDKIILWTCREGELLKEAVQYCNDYGLFFHAVNDNLPENIAYYGNNCRKVWAHHYIDDRNYRNIPGSARNADIERLVLKSKVGGLYFNDTEWGLKLEPHEIEPHQRRLLLERLHAYEDTDLTPEQIRKLKERNTAKAPNKKLRHRGGFETFHCPNCDTSYQMDRRYTITDEYCPKCGKLLDSSFRSFCANCGQRLEEGR